MSRLWKKIANISPDGLAALLLAAWWLLNVVLGGIVELADDEAYYWAWTTVAAEKDNALQWGYFDHPPMVAWLVWLSSWLPGSLGVRFCSLLLLPLCLYLFWTVIRPSDATRRDAWCYVLVCFAMPVLQLYGLLALPDAPLLAFSVAVLWAFKRLVNHGRWSDAVLFGIATALLGFSKYHGLLVVVLLVASHPKVLKSSKIYVAAVIALVLYLPHLLWQQQHGWPSFAYHLIERNEAFEWENVGDFLASLLVVFNPLFLYHCCWKGWKNDTGAKNDGAFDLRRCLAVLAVGFVVFFTLSSCKKYVQVQWVLPIVLSFVYVVWCSMRSATSSSRERRYLRVSAIVTAVLFLAVRGVAAAGPSWLKGELWDNNESNSQIAALAGNRPVQFSNGYADAAKYAFYTHKPTYALPVYYGRSSQWAFNDGDEAFEGQDVVVQVEENCYADTMPLADGRAFKYVVIHDFHSTRKVAVRLPSETLDANVGDTLHLPISIDNPYPYDLVSTADEPLQLTVFFKYTQRQQPECKIPLADTLKAHSTTTMNIDVPVPSLLDPGHRYPCGICVGYLHFRTLRNSPPLSITINDTGNASYNRGAKQR